MDGKLCAAQYCSNGAQSCSSPYAFDTARQLCSGRLTGGADTCQGDSGGPLVAMGANAAGGGLGAVIGVTSYGIGCAQPRLWSVYTRTSYYAGAPPARSTTPISTIPISTPSGAPATGTGADAWPRVDGCSDARSQEAEP